MNQKAFRISHPRPLFAEREVGENFKKNAHGIQKAKS